MTSGDTTSGDAARPHDPEPGEAATTKDKSWRAARKPGKHAAQGPPGRGLGQPGRAEAVPSGGASAEPRSPALGAEPVARRTATGWRVGDEEVSDLTSAMVLADLLAADLPAEGPPTPGGPAAPGGQPAQAEPTDTQQLQETVAQLEHALTDRVRVEQAVGV